MLMDGRIDPRSDRIARGGTFRRSLNQDRVAGAHEDYDVPVMNHTKRCRSFQSIIDQECFGKDARISRLFEQVTNELLAVVR